MAAKVWSFKTYVPYLKAQLTGPEQRGRLSRAGEALGVQRSYLSRVLAGELHLTSDHAYRLSEFFEMSAQDRDYFLALVEIERASSVEYRDFQKRRASDMRKKFESLENRPIEKSWRRRKTTSNTFPLGTGAPFIF